MPWVWAKRRVPRLRPRLSAQQGLTIVEVMVAAMVLVIGALAIFKIVDAATRTSYRAEQSQVVSNLLQRELERVKAMEPAEMAVVANGSPSASACLTERTEAATRGPAGGVSIPAIDPDDLITENGTIQPCEDVSVSPGEGSDSSDVGVRVFRFVSWYDPDKENCTPPPEADEDDEDVCGMRRIVIGALPHESGPGGERTYKEIQSDIVDVPGEA